VSTYYVEVDGKLVFIGETELFWLAERLPDTKLARDLDDVLHHPEGRPHEIILTLSPDTGERAAFRSQAADIASKHPGSTYAETLDQLCRLLR
jgi:hypothetical protein